MNSHYPEYTVLVVDDETDVLHSEALALRLDGIGNVQTCSDAREVLAHMAARPCKLVILDINMPHLDGVALLDRILEQYPDTTVIMLTGRDDAETAVRCMKLGAFDYLVKPVDDLRFVTAIRKGIEHRSLRDETSRLGRSLLSGQLRNPEAFAHIVGCDPRLRDICRYIEAIAPTRMPVLITGETGTGKELFALAIHRASGATGEFVPVNTAGIDDSLLSDTLFGHRKGAFTGADRDREGLVDKARHGTLFLDEIGDLRPESQIKLLRVLQEGVYYPVGADTPRQCLARIVAATNVDLGAARDGGQFRKDLFYRLQSHRFHIPPLRERRADIPALARHFLAQAARETNKKMPLVPRDLDMLLENYPFPGNIRELRGFIFDAMVRHETGDLSLASLKDAVGLRSQERPASAGLATNGELLFPDPLPGLRQWENLLVAEAIRRAGGNKSVAARMLGVTRKTLRAKAGSENAQGS